MSIVDPDAGIGEAGLRRLRHDLLNSVHVLIGTTSMLLDTTLDEKQRSFAQTIQNTARRLLDTTNALDTYRQQSSIDGPAQLADLCSIAVARLDKPFARSTLLSVIRSLAPATAPRILLVDDAPEMAVLVRAFLADTPCTVDAVADGESAVAQTSSQAYDLVLMDVDLPGLDGATAAHAIRAIDLARGAKPTPVVAMSAVAAMTTPVAHDDEAEPVVVLEDADTASLVPAFLDNRRQDVHAIRTLLDQGEFGRIQAVGHRMKGTGRSYGFTAISSIGADIERAAHQDDAGALEKLADVLDAYLSRVKIEAR